MQSSELMMYREQWKCYRADVKKNGEVYAWRIHSDAIESAWFGFMRDSLCLMTFSMLYTFIEKWKQRREMWLVPGGYFYTLRDKRRRRLLEKNKPQCSMLSKEITSAGIALRKATTLTHTAMEMSTLLMESGTVYVPHIPKGDPAYTYNSTKKMRFSRRFSKVRWWERMTDNRLRYMVERRMLWQPDNRRLG